MTEHVEPGRREGEIGPPVTVTVGVEPWTVAGGVVLATVTTHATRDVVLQGGEVTLGYALAYRYSTGGIFGTSYFSTARRSADVAREPLPGPTLLRAGRDIEQQALLRVPPDALPSVGATLVTIAWSVRTRVFFEGTGEAYAGPVGLTVRGGRLGGDGAGGSSRGSGEASGGAATGSLGVAATGSGFPVDALPAGAAGLRGKRDSVTFERVSSRRFAPGTRITGDVVIGSRRGGDRFVRVELVLVELVPHGPMIGDDPSRNPYIAEKESESVLVRRSLAAGAAVPVSGSGVRLPFTVDVPSRVPSPTLITPDFTLRWFLRAVVQRRLAVGLRRSTTTDLEVLGSTA